MLGCSKSREYRASELGNLCSSCLFALIQGVFFYLLLYRVSEKVAYRILRVMLGDQTSVPNAVPSSPNWPKQSRVVWIAQSGPKICSNRKKTYFGMSGRRWQLELTGSTGAPPPSCRRRLGGHSRLGQGADQAPSQVFLHTDYSIKLKSESAGIHCCDGRECSP